MEKKANAKKTAHFFAVPCASYREGKRIVNSDKIYEGK